MTQPSLNLNSHLNEHKLNRLNASQRWSYLFSERRLGSRKQQNTSEKSRTPFHKDYDRLIFSQSFRQLNQKTQVHPLTNQLGIHTRLTHSLEVSCIGRSLGMMAAERLHDLLPDGLPRGISVGDVGVIVQAACLAHDIGNPPFGHAGEYAIRDWFNHTSQHAFLSYLAPAQRLDLQGYEGNAQGFRLLTRNEHHPDRGGMRLTCATLGAFMKYPWLAKHSNATSTYPSHLEPTLNTTATQQQATPTVSALDIKKYGCFFSDATLLDKLAGQLRLPYAPNHDGYARHPLAYLLEAADDICYALIDLEDGIHLNMIEYQEVEPLMLRLIGSRGTPPEVTQNAPVVQKLAALRGRAMMRLVDKVTQAFVTHSETLLAGELQGSLFEHCEPSVKDGIAEAKQLASTQIFAHPSKIRMELMANRCLHTLLDAFMPLALLPIEQQPLHFEQKHLLQLLNQHLHTLHRQLGTDVYANALNILDYITGMNDHEAYRLAQDLNGIGGDKIW
ncbi:deoxyguanosinetriphosphate triphosphohydrolase [Psychrobacter lutiphocae]|uniref:deoxyguanosinetriphosphate triphosphohydrolase n=1 Tax=Psychrobacter lutiphocae TaxID=540500 RepID=UPI00038220CE|nr:deoxyguanosinetriphosphate triphosphohydrolase [Psychrobacter lutiphocae]